MTVVVTKFYLLGSVYTPGTQHIIQVTPHQEPDV